MHKTGNEVNGTNRARILLCSVGGRIGSNRQSLTDSDITTRNLRVGVGRLLENKERWKELCELAAKEQDPKKLIELMKEIDNLLEVKLNRLKGSKPNK
jgi:hypothetical protein